MSHYDADGGCRHADRWSAQHASDVADAQLDELEKLDVSVSSDVSRVVGQVHASVLEVENATLRRLHVRTRRLLSSLDLDSALREVLSAAIELQQADFGDIHVLDGSTGMLRLAVQQGLPKAYLAHVAQVDADHVSACGRALQRRRRIVIEDVDLDDRYALMRPLAAQTGYRAVSATPLSSRSGQLLGMLSLHFRRPFRPSERALRILDLYARQAGDVIERLQAEQALRAAYEGRKRFIATLAHELRGPLAALRNAVELLSRPNLRSDVHEQATAIARRQLDQTVQLVDDLFDLARLGASKLKLRKQRLPAKEVLQMALDVSQSGIAAAGIDLHVSIQPADLSVFVDPARFAQVIANLLNNAAKFTPEKGRVRLECYESAETVVIKVQDSGIGMGRDTVSRVFDAFEQAAEETGRNRGLGLGLPIARRIVEMHGGEITAHSDGPGKGAVFTVVLPSQRLDETA